MGVAQQETQSLRNQSVAFLCFVCLSCFVRVIGARSIISDEMDAG